MAASERAFADRVVADLAGAATSVIAAIGDRLGLWKDLARHGPGTLAAIALRTGLAERALHQWLAAMVAAGYVAFDAGAREFGLAPFQAAVLADEGGPWFLAGAHEATLGVLDPVEQVIAAFRTGTGVSRSGFPERAFGGLERVLAPWLAHAVIARWLPRAIADRLAAGADVADLACKRGDALLAFAETFPASRYTGFDAYGANIARARARADERGLASVRFIQADATTIVPHAAVDIVVLVDALGDIADPRTLLAAARRALRPGGVALCLELSSDGAASPAFETLRHGLGVLLRSPTAFAHGDLGAASAGLAPSEVEELAHDAGFERVEVIVNAHHALYELHP